ncbi:MAG TPA: helix-turn-helix domain-containing protein, partial [Acidimicrobiales bacterium]|nr:helix-turn-helix domain-containing protein [Acidimicrobiales bacterium]
GSATPGELARVANVPRTSSYQVLEELQRKGLAERLPGQGPAVWGSRQPGELLARLHAAEEERLRQHKVRTDRVQEMLERAFPQRPSPSLPYVNVIHDPSQVKPVYEELLQGARSELLVFNRPPYTWSPGMPNPVVLETAARVSTRALYQAPEVEDPGAELWRRELEAYHAAGVEGRVVEDLPLKLAVVDRRVALLTVDDPLLPQVGFPITLLVEHPGFAVVQADAFDYRWETALPYRPTAGGRTQETPTLRAGSRTRRPGSRA